jgi:hypothetical protein
MKNGKIHTHFYWPMCEQKDLQVIEKLGGLFSLCGLISTGPF